MKPLILDASAALALLRDEPGSQIVLSELRRATKGGRSILVPPLFWLEVVNVLARRYRYPPEAVVEAVYELEEVGIVTAEIGKPTTLAVIDAMGRTGLTAYDALYIVLAESSDATMVTGDSALSRAAGSRAVLIGAGGGIGEERSDYQVLSPWPRWRGAERYLRDLRASVQEA